jgi:hypothetical protein
MRRNSRNGAPKALRVILHTETVAVLHPTGAPGSTLFLLWRGRLASAGEFLLRQVLRGFFARCSGNILLGAPGWFLLILHNQRDAPVQRITRVAASTAACPNRSRNLARWYRLQPHRNGTAGLAFFNVGVSFSSVGRVQMWNSSPRFPSFSRLIIASGRCPLWDCGRPTTTAAPPRHAAHRPDHPPAPPARDTRDSKD